MNVVDRSTHRPPRRRSPAAGGAAGGRRDRRRRFVAALALTSVLAFTHRFAGRTTDPSGDGDGGRSGAGSFLRRGATPNRPDPRRRLRPVQLQIVHRHDDRTPITPLADPSYWSSLLPSDETLSELASTTRVVRSTSSAADGGGKKAAHAAGGGEIFGRLTRRGLRQMIDLGSSLRSEVESLASPSSSPGYFPDGYADPNSWLKVSTTDFGRTVQSVQGTLRGLLGGGKDGAVVVVDVDASRTDRMIPDPQPRRYVGQADLERELQSSKDFVERERMMRPLAVRVTAALRDAGIIDGEATKVSFGVGEDGAADGDGASSSTEKEGDDGRPLPWNQLAEITKCLRTNDRLPPSISVEDEEEIERHNAWRWFALLGNDALGRMAMKSLVKKIVLNAEEGAVADVAGAGAAPPSAPATAPLLHLFSGHDATLIGLICAFKLERPGRWPGYGSHLKVELLRDDDENDGGRRRRQFYARFSLDGTVLRSRFGGRGGGRGGSGEEASSSSPPRDLIPLDELVRGMKDVEDGLPPPIDDGGNS